MGILITEITQTNHALNLLKLKLADLLYNPIPIRYNYKLPLIVTSMKNLWFN